MYTSLKVFDNTVVVREGRAACRVTVLEKCRPQYRVLHSLEQLMRGEFLANSRHLASR